MALASATALLAELHGLCTRAVEHRVGVHDGLTTAARTARRRGLLSSATARRRAGSGILVGANGEDENSDDFK